MFAGKYIAVIVKRLKRERLTMKNRIYMHFSYTCTTPITTKKYRSHKHHPSTIAKKKDTPPPLRCVVDESPPN